MKKTYLVCIILAVLVLAVGAGMFVLTGGAVDEAEAMQTALFEQYMTMQQNAAATTLSVLEDGVVVGDYTLEDLGLLPQVQAAIDSCFTETERLDPASFSNLPVDQKLDWGKEEHSTRRRVSVDAQAMDPTAVLSDLRAMSRRAAENAYVEFQDGTFLIHEEVPGTELNEETVTQAIRDLTGTMEVNDGMPMPVQLELLDYDCYLLPELTVENSYFDLDSMLRDSVQDMTVTVDFHGKEASLRGEQLETLLAVNDKGRVVVEEEPFNALMTQWAADYKEGSVPYLFDSYVDGEIPLEFLKVDYDVDVETLKEELSESLVDLKDIQLEAPYLCWYQGEPLDLGDEYIEVDINNQVMTYVKDGEVLVTTDVVTGATWGYPTPEGLYDVNNKDEKIWLRGEDYNVYVDYWIGVVGYMIGIHDADWRTKFGGDNYINNGSHGCINTPKDQVKIIFDNVELGVPVIMHGK